MCIATFPKSLKHPKFSLSSESSSELINHSKIEKYIDISNITTCTPFPKSNFVVQHDYHDHAKEQLDQQLSNNNRPVCRGGVATPFPLKLHEMLDKAEEDGFADIISWQPHGRCFVIHQPKKFSYILPKYFKLSKITSFQRQLNLYGFTRLTSGRDKGGYYHELFLRGKQFLANKIQRIKVKGTGVRARSNPKAEPNLWQMEWVGACDNVDTASSMQCNNSTKNNLVKTHLPIQQSQSNNDPATVCSFEGKQFHCLVRTGNLQGDLTYNEIEEILSDLPDLHSGDLFEVQSDAVLADLLERAIA